MKFYLIFITILLFIPFNAHSERVEYVSLKDIKKVEDKVKLKKIKEWGGEGENQCFFYPSGIKVSEDNKIYILDMGNCQIQVFESSGKFVKTIGKRGEGPGEFLFPISFTLDNHGNIIVAEDRNRRIQILSSEGNYRFSFKILEGYPGRIDITKKDEIAVYNPIKLFKSHSLVELYNYEGKLLRVIGKYKRKVKNIEELEGFNLAIDKSDNFYIAYTSTPQIEKYSYKGDLESVIKLETPFKNNQLNPFSAGLSIDDYGRIYLVVATRVETEKERRSLTIVRVSKKGWVSLVRPPLYIDSEETDLYKLIVFDCSGKLIASKQLRVFCSGIYVHNDRLFIIDTLIGMKIYEYKISFD